MDDDPMEETTSKTQDDGGEDVVMEMEKLLEEIENNSELDQKLQRIDLEEASESGHGDDIAASLQPISSSSSPPPQPTSSCQVEDDDKLSVSFEEEKRPESDLAPPPPPPPVPLIPSPPQEVMSAEVTDPIESNSTITTTTTNLVNDDSENGNGNVLSTVTTTSSTEDMNLTTTITDNYEDSGTFYESTSSNQVMLSDDHLLEELDMYHTQPIVPESFAASSPSKKVVEEEEEEVSYGSSDLFKEVKFAICEDVSELDKIKKVLVAHGAKFLNYLSDSATHLIADNPDHLNVSEAIDIYEKPVVTSQWVWLSLRAQHLLPLEPFSPLGDRLFSHVVVCPSGLPLADRQRIWSMVTYFGGRFMIRLDSQCTHLVTTRTGGAKYDTAELVGSTAIKVVTPDWVVDSVKQKKLCDESRYHPRLLVTYHGGAKSSPTSAVSQSTSSANNSGNNAQAESDEPAEQSSRTKSVTMSISTDAVVVTARKSDPVPVSESPVYQPVPQQSLLQKPLQLRPLGVRMVNRAPAPPSSNVHLQTRQPRPSMPRQPRPTPPRMPSQVVRPPSQSEMPNLPVTVNASSTQHNTMIVQGKPQQAIPPQYQQSPMPPGQHYANQPVPSTPPAQAGPPVHPQQPRQVYLTPQQQVVYHPNQYQARQFIRQRPPPSGQMPQQLSPQQQQLYRQQQYQQLQQQRARQQVPVTVQAQFQRVPGPVVTQQAQPSNAGPMQSPQMYQPRPPISPQQMQRMQQPGMPQNQFHVQQPMPEGQMNAQQMQQFQQQHPQQQHPQQQHPQQQHPQQQHPQQQHPQQQHPQQQHPQQQHPQQQHPQQQHPQQQHLQQQQQPGPRLVRFQGQEMTKVVPPQMIAQQQLPPQGQAYPQTNQMRPVMAQQQQPPQQVAMMKPQMMQQANGPRIMMRAMHPIQQQQYQQQPSQQMVAEGQKMPVAVGQPQQTHPGVMNRSQGQMQYAMQVRQRWPPSDQYPNQPVNQTNQVPPNQLSPQQQQQFRMMQQQQGGTNQMSIQQQQAWIRQQQIHQQRFHMQQQGQMVRLQQRPNGFSMMQQHPPVMGPQQVSPHDPKVRPNVSSSATSGTTGSVPETPVSSQTAQTGPPSSTHLLTAKTILVSANAQVYQVAPGKSPTPGSAQASPGLTHSSPSSSGTSTPTSVPATTPATTASTGPLAVNEKTKTALANLLTTRLHLQQQSNGAQQLPNGQSGASVAPSATGGQSTKLAPMRSLTSVTFHHEVQTPPVATLPPAPVPGGPELVSPTVPSHSVPYPPHPQAHVHPMPHPPPHSHPGQQVYPRVPVPQHQHPHPSHVAHPHPPTPMVTHLAQYPPVHHQSIIPSSKVQTQVQPLPSAQSNQYSQIGPYPAMSMFQPPLSVQPIPPPAKPMIRFFGHEHGPIPEEFCLVGCVFYIAPSYTESPSTGSLVAGWRRRIERFGGRVVDQYQPEVTHLITEHMQGPLPKQAMADGKRCVSILWLDDILANGRVLPPWRIYHLPVAYNHSGPCSHHIISTSNFDKDERAIIRHLIVRTGAKYTNYLTSKNTILICKKSGGVKYDKAVQWRIPIVNLLWLQDILFGHLEALQLSNLARKYKSFDLLPTVAVGSKGEMTFAQMTQKDSLRLEYSCAVALMNPWRVPLKLDDAELARLVQNRKEENEKKAIDAKETEAKAQNKAEQNATDGLNVNNQQNDSLNEKNKSNESNLNSRNEENESKSETNTSNENVSQPESNHIGESTEEKNENCDESKSNSSDSKMKECEAKLSDTSGSKNDSNPDSIKMREQPKLENGPITNGPTDGNSNHSLSMNDSNDMTINDSSNNSTLEDVITVVESGNKRNFDEAMLNEKTVPMVNGVLGDEEDSSHAPAKKTKHDHEVIVKMEVDEAGSDGGEEMTARTSFELDEKHESFEGHSHHEENSATNDSFASHPPVPITNGDHNESFTTDSLSGPADDVQFKVPFDVKCSVDILLTGVAAKERNRLEEIILSLGGRVVRDTKTSVTHLVLSSTTQLISGQLPINFFCAFARAQYVLTTRWLEDSGRAGRFLPEVDFTLQDREAEQYYQLDLKRSLATRSVDLFRGMIFLLTRSLVPSPQVLMQIIEANGGTAVIKQFPTKRQLADLAARQLKFLVISCPNDLHTCDYFFDQNIDVLSHTFILDAIIKQQLDYKSFILRRPDTR